MRVWRIPGRMFDGTPVFLYRDERIAQKLEADEPGLWLPLSARAEMREQIRDTICPNCFTPDNCPAANAVVRLIFGADPDGGDA